jgi:hypothetical protein
MDQLLFFALFVLFSVVSALLERRKRRQSLEEARQRHEATGKQRPVAKKVEVEEEEKQGNWPWPEIFEQPPSRPRRVEVERVPVETASTEVSAAEALPGEGKYRRAEEELQEMERRVQEMDQRTREADRQSQEEFHLMEEQAALRMGTGAGQRRPARTPEGGARARQGWGLNPREARRALVYAEILGPPKSERSE